MHFVMISIDFEENSFCVLKPSFDFPGGPVVKTSYFQCRRSRFKLVSELIFHIYHKMWTKNVNIKNKQSYSYF